MGQNDRGFLMKTYGGIDPNKKKYPLSDKDAKNWPELEKTLANLSIDDRTKSAIESVGTIRPMGFLQRFLSGNAHGSYNPITNSLALNRNVINEDNVGLNNVLSHELKHVDQRNRLGLLSTLFGNRQNLENEAYFSEFSPPIRKDIRLPNEPGVPVGIPYERPGPLTHSGGLIDKAFGGKHTRPKRVDIHLPDNKKKVKK